MRLRFRRHVRDSLATQLIRLAWWIVGGTGLSTVFFTSPAWVIGTTVCAWIALQAIAHALLALDDDEADRQ
ncbi:hypothetical protein T31B1_18837 [Salinisphaera sp. T31B1]